MYLPALAFISGVLTLPLFSTIPSFVLFLSAFILITLLWKFISQPLIRQIAKCLFFILLGCVFVLFRAEQLLQWQLPENLETKTITATGTIASLPKIEDDFAQFQFVLDSLNHEKQQAKIKLSWYHYKGTPALNIGDRWQFNVRLKRPHGLLNPGSFDYEKLLFSQGVRATGYVTNPTTATFLGTTTYGYQIDKIRQYLQQKMQAHLKEEKTAGLIIALVMGAQNGISQDQWQVMRATGTNHLMSISGMHIVFISGFIYALINFLWRRAKKLSLSVPAPQAAAMAGLITAVIYSALAGFSLPTQRALIMLFVFMGSVFLRRLLNPWNAFVLALLLVVLLDPFGTLSVSLWLSFMAVFAIIYGVSQRVKPAGLWWKYGQVQWVITLFLIPFSLILFQQTSIISLAANFIAIPAVGFLVLPLSLLGALFAVIFPWLAHWTLWLAAEVLSLIWLILGWFAQLPGAIFYQTMPSFWVFAAALIGVLWLIAPRGFPTRFVGLFFFTPLLFFKTQALEFGALNMHVLDVGQGLAVVIQTQHHTLIFDTGPPMGKHDDAATRVILPFLQAENIKKVDALVVSHGDSDHSGGAFSLLKKIPVTQIFTSSPERFIQYKTNVCQAGQSWEWDGVTFRMLYPPENMRNQGNNSSCILRVETKQRAILLTGDIEKSAEAYLVKHSPELLSSTILIAPHHGSLTSSTVEFVNAVNPTHVIFSTGYKNRFQFPNKLVVARYQQINAYLLDTADSGAIKVEMGSTHKVSITTERIKHKKIWHE